MTDDDRHERVLDTLLDLQAHLRGDASSRRLQVSEKQDAPERSDPAPSPEPHGVDEPGPPLRIAPEPISVREDDLEVIEGDAPTSADRLAALSERLQRMEDELSTAMDRLRTAEERYVGDEDMPEPPPEVSDREVYHRVMQLQHLASSRRARRGRR